MWLEKCPSVFGGNGHTIARFVDPLARQQHDDDRDDLGKRRTAREEDDISRNFMILRQRESCDAATATALYTHSSNGR